MKGFWMILVGFAAAGLTGCPDGDDTCNDCSCDPSLCDGGGDADADATGDDGTAGYGDLTVTSTPVQGAAITLDGDPTGEVTDHTFTHVAAEAHSVLLSLAGRLQVSDTGELNQPVEANVTPDGTTVNIVLYYDLTGRWQLVGGTGEIVDVTMGNRNLVTAYPPTSFCPYTTVIALNFQPLTAVCVEADGTLSLCKDHTSDCGGFSAEGVISSDGRRVEFTKHELGTDLTFVYTKLD